MELKIIKRRITIIDIIHNGIKPALSISLKIIISCGMIATFLGITKTNIPFYALLLGAFALVLYFPLLCYWTGKGSHMPDIFASEESIEISYKAELSSANRLEEACNLTKPYYGNEFVPPEQAEQWRQKNPKAFVDILNKDGLLIASFGIIRPKDNFFKSFLDGQTSDTLLRGENICSLWESKQSAQLYISGVVVRDSERNIGKWRAKIMVWAMLQYYKKYYGLKKTRELFAVAVNNKSSIMLRRMGFTLKTEGRNRMDKCDLFYLKLNKEEWNRIIKRTGDCSEICSLEYS